MIALLAILVTLGFGGALCVAMGLAQAASERREWSARIVGDDAGEDSTEIALLTLAVPDGGGVYAWSPSGPECLLCNCPAGLFVHKGEIGIKGLPSGEAGDQVAMMQEGNLFRMWSRAADLWVQPVTIAPVDPAPLWIEQQ